MRVKCDLSRLFPAGGILGVVPSTSLQNACLPPPPEEKKEREGWRGRDRERERRDGRWKRKRERMREKRNRHKHEGLRVEPTRLLVTTRGRMRIDIAQVQFIKAVLWRDARAHFLFLAAPRCFARGGNEERDVRRWNAAKGLSRLERTHPWWCEVRRAITTTGQRRTWESGRSPVPALGTPTLAPSTPMVRTVTGCAGNNGVGL